MTISVEQLFDEMETHMAQYSQFIKELRGYRLTEDQINKVLLLVYQYRFVNAVDSLKDAKITQVGDEEWS